MQTDRHAILPFDFTDIVIGRFHSRRLLAAIYEAAYGFIRKAQEESMLRILRFSRVGQVAAANCSIGAAPPSILMAGRSIL